MLKKLTKITNDNINSGASFTDIILNVNLERLIDVFGNPTKIGSPDKKTQLKWIFTDKKNEKHITIYDWKNNAPIYEINRWSVGSKKLDKNEVYSILMNMGFQEKNEIVYVD